MSSFDDPVLDRDFRDRPDPTQRGTRTVGSVDIRSLVVQLDGRDPRAGPVDDYDFRRPSGKIFETRYGSLYRTAPQTGLTGCVVRFGPGQARLADKFVPGGRLRGFHARLGTILAVSDVTRVPEVPLEPGSDIMVPQTHTVNVQASALREDLPDEVTILAFFEFSFVMVFDDGVPLADRDHPLRFRRPPFGIALNATANLGGYLGTEVGNLDYSLYYWRRCELSELDQVLVNDAYEYAKKERVV